MDEVARLSRGSGEVPFSSGPFYLSEDRAAAELFLRLNHARQSIAFVKRQARPLRLLFLEHNTTAGLEFNRR